MKYSAWGEQDSNIPDTLVPGIQQPRFANGNPDIFASKFFFTIEAESFEQAKEIFNERLEKLNA